MNQKSNVFLMFVDAKDVQSNKFYNMVPSEDGNTFEVQYGRVGATATKMTYPMSKWNSIYKSKTRKGYKDISSFKEQKTVISTSSGNSDFDEFYQVFSRYTGNMVRKSYIVEGCTQAQIDEAQHILDKIVKLKRVDAINRNLLELYKIIPRRMDNVRNYLLEDPNQKDRIVDREQQALDSMDSNNITNTSNPYNDIGVDFSLVKDIKKIEKLLYPTMDNYRKVKIHKVYKIIDKDRTSLMDNWISSQTDKTCELLIHGTRNPNVFSILKSGLLVRPTNAASFAGSAYGDGIYHSAHTAKSLNYTGWDADKVFLLQNVHMGNRYTYNGWYRDGKDISRSEMNYRSLKKKGYDSLYVKPGDGLLNSEYIVYNKEQTNTQYLVWMK